jgi:hypothetical protein
MKVLRVAAAVLALLAPRAAFAQQITEDVPIVGGMAATARALGVDVVPDRPRFFAELVRVIYDTREGRNLETDAKLVRLTNHRAVTERIQNVIAATAATGISLKMASDKVDRARLEDFLDLVGLKLREKNKVFRVEPTADKRALDRVKLLSALGIDLARLAATLNAGDAVRIEVPRETIPVPLTARIWSDAIFQRPVLATQLFAEIMADRRAALLAHGLAGVDDETLRYLVQHPTIVGLLYEHHAAAFAAFGDGLRIRNGRVVPPGGADGVRVWEAIVGDPVTQPDRFVQDLYAANRGRVALIYESIGQLDDAHVRFAVGSWLADPNARVDQFKALVGAETSRQEWDVDLRPFTRPVHDVTMLLTRVRVQPNGAPARPNARLFWHRAFESADLLDDPARRLRNLQEEGVIDAGWLAQDIATDDPRARAARFDQLAFGQRVFAAATDEELPDALLAVRGVVRFRMLMLALDRIGARSPKVYAAALREAEQVTLLDAQRGYATLAQFQSAIAIVNRLVRVHSITPATGVRLVETAVAVTFNDDGAYAGGMARWVERSLLPSINAQPSADVDAQLMSALAGVPVAEARKIDWEGHIYNVDLVSPEQRRLTKARDKMGAPTIRLALDLEHVAARLTAPGATVPTVRESLAQLRQFSQFVETRDKKTAVLPPGVEFSKSPADRLEKVVEELTKVSRPQDLERTPRAVAPLLVISDDVLADALLSLTYALDIGNPEGTTMMGGNVSHRHDFGYAIRENERRLRFAWSQPTRMLETGVPWHVAGSVLGLDGALSVLALRRIDTGEIPQAPVLMMPDRDTFTKTLAWLNPFDLSDADRDAIVAAIDRGRTRVAGIAADAAWDEAADTIRMDGWRRRAGRWAIAHDKALVPSFFSLAELMFLGVPPADLPLDSWGMASDGSDACACVQAPQPGRAAIFVGRPQLGLLATEVADVNLHIAELLSARKLPASLAPGVLAAALQDYIDQVRPLHASDWLTLVRAAQTIPDDRVDDYVAALTTDGPLAPDRPAGGPEGKEP